MRTLYVGAQRDTLIERLRTVLAAVEAASGADGAVEVTLDGEPNIVGEDEIRVVFTNDDMEDRPEMVGRVLLDWEG